MNLSNQLTVLRIILAFICMWLITLESFAGLLAGFIVFLIASITDYFDGYVARKYNMISDLGKILDPLADKVLIIGVYLAFLQINAIVSWVVAAIIVREFIVTGLRFFALNKGVVMEAKFLGKHKTFAQIAAAVIIFLSLILNKSMPELALSKILFNAIPALMIYVVFITIFSGLHYLWANRKLIKTF